ncbi:Putative AC transposase [Linum grandiflorum]
MARDILAIPITSVASESSFSLGGRVLTKWRTCILSDTLEAIMTARNWLYGYEMDKIVIRMLFTVSRYVYM